MSPRPRPSDALDPLRTRFGSNARALRARQGISQEELGFMTALHRTEIGLLERGIRLPRLDTIVKLSCALEATPNDMLAGISWSPGGIGPEGFAVLDEPEQRDGDTSP